MPPENEDDPRAGTTAEAVDGDPGTPSVEEESARLRRENAELRDKHDKALAEKANAEATARENEQLKAIIQQGYRPSPQPDPNEVLRASILELSQWAADPSHPLHHSAVAQLTSLRIAEETRLKVEAMERRSQQSADEQESLAKVPPQHRDQTRTYYEQNRRRFALPEDAYWALKGQGQVKDAEPDKVGEERRKAAPSMPVSSPEPATTEPQVLRMKRSAYIQMSKDGHPQFMHYRNLKDQGKLILTD